MDWIFLIPITIALITLMRPDWGVAALAGLWPSYLLRTEVAGIPTTALELSIYAAALIMALRLITRRTRWHWNPLPTDTYYLAAAWGVAWLTATFMAADREAALGALKAWWLDPHIFMVLMILTIRTINQRRLLTNTALMSGVIVALAGFAQLIWFSSTLQEGRLSSFFAPVANYASMYLGPLIVLLGSLLIHDRGTRWQWFAVAVMTLALLLTLSFGGFLAVAAGLFFSWLLLTNSARKRQLALVGGAVILLGLIGLTQTKNFAQHFDFSGRSSGSARQQIWVTSWALIKQDPWFGVGPNNFETAYRAELPKHYFPPLEWLVSQPHNLYLALWLETGLLGLITFGWFIVHHFRLAWKQFFHDPANRNLAIASLAAMVAVFVHGLVDTTFFKNDLAVMFSFLIVLPWLGQKK